MLNIGKVCVYLYIEHAYLCVVDSHLHKLLQMRGECKAYFIRDIMLSYLLNYHKEFKLLASEEIYLNSYLYIQWRPCLK